MNILLLIFSILIYASFGLTNLIYILFSILTTYYGALHLNKKNKKRKLIFRIVIILNISLLVFFKFITYNNFFNLFKANSILVPLGVSYYTFQVLAYFIDVYQGKIKPEKNFFNYLLFVFYIPYLFIGPINRYEDLKKTLFKKRKFTLNNLVNGTLRICFGLFKKYVIASRIALVITSITTANLEGAYVLLATLLYSFQLYADFSGGIDIVLGFSSILGITLQENFKQPYLAINMQDFWHRWHISLSTWFRDYVYIPLGGNRVSKIRQKLNIIITFIVSGLWHGINYFFWGLFHGLIVAFEPRKKNARFLRIAFNFLLVSLLWSFFIYPNSFTALKMVLSIFYQFNYGDLAKNILNLGLDLGNIMVLIISLISLIGIDLKYEKIKNWLYNKNNLTKLTYICFIILIILVFGVYGLGFNTNDFIYSKF